MQDYSLYLFLLAVVALAALLAVALLAVLWRSERRQSRARIEELLQTHQKGVEDARRESVQRSRSTLKGRIAEQLAPLLPGFPYDPSDARFLGDPIDYVVFSGYARLRDEQGPDEDLDIVLLEVKQGGSALSPFQKAIARCVTEGRVRFEICRVAEDGSATSEIWRPAGPGRRAFP